MPPQTKRVCPVTKPFAGAAKKATARATSSGSPMRPTGMDAARRASCSLPEGTIAWYMSVRTGPGATTLTVMPSPASSSAQVRARPSSAALVAE